MGDAVTVIVFRNVFPLKAIKYKGPINVLSQCNVNNIRTATTVLAVCFTFTVYATRQLLRAGASNCCEAVSCDECTKKYVMPVILSLLSGMYSIAHYLQVSYIYVYDIMCV